MPLPALEGRDLKGTLPSTGAIRLLALLAVCPAWLSGQGKPDSGELRNAVPDSGVIQEARSDSNTPRAHFRTLLILDRDSLWLSPVDSTSRTDLWLGYQYEKVGRRKDAESSYLKVLANASDSLRPYVRARLQAIWLEDREAEFEWFANPFRPVVLWFMHWPLKAEALWLVGLGALLFWLRRTRKAGRNQLRVQTFTRNLPAEVGLGVEKTIAEYLRRTVEVGQPIGVLLHSGQKLPVLSTSPAEDFLNLLNVVGPPSWLTKGFERLLRQADKPRFVVSGHATGTLNNVQLVATLQDDRSLIGSWDYTFHPDELVRYERMLACKIVFALSERPQ
jgi:hypothetical protein